MKPNHIQQIALLLVALSSAVTAQTPAWRYDLKTGDHLIYTYSFQRHSQSDDSESQVEVQFETHVLVAGENSGRISLGFQRNRISAVLSQFAEKGKDRVGLATVYCLAPPTRSFLCVLCVLCGEI